MIYILGEKRLNNFSKDVMEDIAALWSKALSYKEFREGTKYALYYDYESNYEGDYSLALGVEEAIADKKIEIKNLNYEIFNVKVDVAETWVKIWALEQEGHIDRTYELDYEKYNIDGSIDIYVSIK